MIVKFLGLKVDTSGFPGVRYNTDKMESERGELVLVRNFGALQGIANLRPEDYANYLKAYSAANKRIKKPQLHVVISCKGKEYSKRELTDIAGKWLGEMGYGSNPYLLVFHKDTANNHIHIVSSRIGNDGKKINDSFEWMRAYRALDKILGRDSQRQASRDIADTLKYRFSTRAQFMMLLERRGYSIRMADVDYRISKFGRELAKVDAEQVEGRRDRYDMDRFRTVQLRAIIEKYMGIHSTALRSMEEPKPGDRTGRITGYTSDLFEFLHSKFGLEAVLHFSKGNPPYGYTLIDHHTKSVFKGGDIFPLRQLLPAVQMDVRKKDGTTSEKPKAGRSDAAHGAKQTGTPHNGSNYSKNPYGLHKSEVPAVCFDGAQDAPADMEVRQANTGPPRFDIADDIDDEAVLGRNRRKKRKARTNTR